MNRHLDMLGNEVRVGDLIVYPTAQGSSSAQMNFADVEAIDDIVKLPSGTWTLHCYRNRQHPTVYMPQGVHEQTGPTYRDRKFIPDPDRSYVLRVLKLDNYYAGYSKPKVTILKNIDRVTVVTGIISPEVARTLDKRRDQRQRALDGQL